MDECKPLRTGWLRAYSGTVLLVSHDELLLENGVVGRCRLTVSKPVLKAPMASALEATI